MEEVWSKYIDPILQQRQALVAASGVSSGSVGDPPIAQLGLVPEPQWIEIMSILERTINFCHTGHAICLSNELMKDSYTTRAILNGHLPLLAGVIGFSIVNSLIPTVALGDWPVDDKGDPLAISRRATQITYSDSQWAVSSLCHVSSVDLLGTHFYFSLLSLQRYFAHFKIQHKMARATRGIQDSYQIINQKLRILGEIAVQAYIDDVKEMVRREIKAVKKDAGKHPHRHNVHWVKARWNNCNQWLKSDHPLSFGRDHNTINTLSRTVAEEDDDRIIAPLPLAREDSISPHSFASRLYNISLAQTRQAVVAPVWREGAAYPVVAGRMVHPTLRKPCARAVEQDPPYQYPCAWGV